MGWAGQPDGRAGGRWGQWDVKGGGGTDDMPTRKIDELIWMALTDTDFRDRLLGGRRREALAALNLTETEQRVVLAVKADTLEAFAGALCQAGGCGI